MRRIAVVVAAALIVLGTSALAQEHPEHPKKDQGTAEHPEHPKKEAAAEMTLDELADAITMYIAQDAKLKGGYFLVYDADEKKPLMLKLDKVHKEKLASLGGGVYFACTDMKADGGGVYDLDFFMKRTASGIVTTEVSVHKKAGKPRYGWKEEGGIWKKVKI